MTAFDAITWWFLAKVFGAGLAVGMIVGPLLVLLAVVGANDYGRDKR